MKMFIVSRFAVKKGIIFDELTTLAVPLIKRRIKTTERKTIVFFNLPENLFVKGSIITRLTSVKITLAHAIKVRIGNIYSPLFFDHVVF